MVRTKTVRPTPKPPGNTDLNPTSGWGRGWVDEWSKYEGEFREGQPHGYGRAKFVTPLRWPQGDKAGYEGEWRNGKPHGDGVGYGQKVSGFRPNGGRAAMMVKRYAGEWRCGERCGKGVEYMAWHTSYASLYGLFLDDTWPRKEYEGEWLDGERCGRGVSFHPTGAVQYDGEWSAGKAHGLGVEHSHGSGEDDAAAASGRAQEGRWEHGELQSSEPVDLGHQLPPAPQCAGTVTAAAAAVAAVETMQSSMSANDGGASGAAAAASPSAAAVAVPMLKWLETKDHANSNDHVAAPAEEGAAEASSSVSPHPASSAEDTDAGGPESKKPRTEGEPET